MGLGDFNPFKIAKKALNVVGDILSWALGLPDEPEAPSVLLNKRSNIAPIPVIYGRRKVGGTQVFLSTGGSDKKYLYMALVLCEGEIDSVESVFINDKPITDSQFSGLIQYEVKTGTDDQTYSTILSGADATWGTNHRLRGVAYIALRFEFNQDAFSGIPEVTAIVKGRKVYDPRTTTTAWSDNPALCLLDYLTNARYGKGLNLAQIDTASFGAAATFCESTVQSYTGGGNIQLFVCNAIISTNTSIFNNVKILLSGMRGLLPYSNGVYSLIIDKDESVSFDLTPDNILSKIDVKMTGKAEKFNKVGAKFVNPESNWQDDVVYYPEPGSQESIDYLAEDNGEELATEITLSTVTNSYTARDVARIALLSSRLNRIRASLTATSEALALSVGDVVRVEHESFGWTNEGTDAREIFRVIQLKLNEDGTVGLELQQYNSAIYPWEVSTELSNGALTNLPDVFSVTPPTNLQVAPYLIENADGGYQSYLQITWTASVDAFVVEYEVAITPAVGDPSIYLVKGSKLDYLVVDTSETFTITVRAVNAAGIRSAAISVASITADIDTTPPGPPTSISVEGLFKAIRLRWTNPTDSDFSYVEVKGHTANSEVDATVLGRISGTEYVDEPFNGVVQKYYWLRSVDRTGNASAWTYAGTATSVYLIADDFDDGVIAIDFLAQGIQDTLAAVPGKVDTSVYTTAISTIQDDVSYTQNQAIDLATTALEGALVAHQTNKTMIDAGVVVDPVTGNVSIYGVEVLQDTVSQVQIDLNAAESTLSLKAEYSYVDQAITEAVFDPSQIADLTDLYARVSQAEIDIDGAESAITLKADLTLINDPTTGLDARITQAEIDIDANTGAISLKASQTDLETLEDRVGTAEINISAIDVPSITQTVYDVRNIYNDIADLSNVSLDNILASYKDRKAVKQDLSFAQQSITADVNDAREASAAARLELLALIDDNTASIVSEQTARATETEALASSITALSVTVDTNTAAITTEQTARATADNVIAQDVLEITGRVDTAEADITAINTVDVNSSSAIASTVAALNATVGDNSADITQINLVSASSTSAIAQAVYGVTSTYDGLTTTVTTNASSIDGIKGQYTVTIDANGFITGYGLVSDIIDGNPTSAFTVAADQFAIRSPVTNPAWSITHGTYHVGDKVNKGGKDYECTSQHVADGTNTPPNAAYWNDITEYAFVVYSTPQTKADGAGGTITLPAGVYMRDGFIQDAAIDSARVQTGAITNAKISGAITSDAVINVGGTEYPQWTIDKNGGAVFRGIEIRDSSNNLLMASGSAMDYSAIGGTKPPSNATAGAAFDVNISGQITSTNASTYIADLAVGTLQIANQAVTFPDASELASSITWGGTTAWTNILAHTFSSTQADTEVIMQIYAGGAGSSSLQVGILLNGTSIVQRSYTYGGVIVISITSADGLINGSNTLQVRAQTSNSGTVIVPFCYIRTLELKK